jgi:putative ABC transport system permease protein
MFRNFLKKTPLALLQISREKPKLLIAILGITFADVLMFVQLGVRDALFDSQLLPLNKLKGDLILVDKRSDNLQSAKIFSRDNLYQALGIKGVVNVNSLYLGITTWRNPDNLTSRQIFVYGIEPNHPAMNSPEINHQLNDLKSLGNVLFDKAGGLSKLGNVPTLLQSQNPLSVQVNDLAIKISGLFTLGSSLGAEGNLIASDSTFLWLFSEAKRQPDEINVGIINLESKEKLGSVKAQLQKILPDNLLVLTMDEFIARERTFWTKDSPVGVIFGFNVAISFLVGTVIVYQILYSDVSKHLPEYATLKAMGYSDRYLVGVILQESLILAILGFMPGFLISAGLYNLAQSATLLPIVMKSSRAISMLALTIFMCIISGAISLRQLQQADPADIF